MDLLFFKEPADGLVSSHEKNVAAVDPNVSGATDSTRTPAETVALQNTFRKLLSSPTYPIKAKTNNSCGSKGKSIVKFVLKTGVTVWAPKNQTASSRNIVAPQAAAKNPLQ